MSLVKRARLVVAAGIVAGSGIAVVAPQITAAYNTNNGGGNSGCYEQLTEYKYQREVEVFKTEYLYKKQTKTVVTHGSDGSTELVSDWAWWEAVTIRWSFQNVDVLESGDHWNWTEEHDGHTDYYDRDYRYKNKGESRQVSGGTTVETTDWVSGPPDGDGWVQIDKRTVKGDEIPCGEPPTYPPDVVEEWGDCATGDTEVTGTKTTTNYVAVYNYDTDTWEKEMDGEPVVETTTRPLTEEEAEACAPVTVPPTSPPTTPETTPPTTPETAPPVVRIAAVTPLCHKDAPYVEVTFGGDAVFDGRAGTIAFVDIHGTTVATHAITFAVGDSVQFLYPGATVDAQGNPTDWPGWKYTNGQWVPDSSDADLRQGLTVVLTVNPTDTATVEYPAASDGCTLPENISANPVTPDAPDLSEFTLPETL